MSSASSITPTPSAFHATPMNSAPSFASSATSQPYPIRPPSPSSSRIPVTPAVLRSIFASSRSVLEERSLSRVAFFRFTGFVLSCLAISLAAARGRVMKSGAVLLGVA